MPISSAKAHWSRHAAYCSACDVVANGGTRRSKRMAVLVMRRSLVEQVAEAHAGLRAIAEQPERAELAEDVGDPYLHLQRVGDVIRHVRQHPEVAFRKRDSDDLRIQIAV